MSTIFLKNVDFISRSWYSRLKGGLKMLEAYKRIRELRISAGLSQDELAKKTGYNDRSSIAKIEAGKVDLTQSKLVAFADALNTTPGYLMGWEPDSKPPIPAGFQPLPKRDRIPRVGQIACGTPILAEENVEAYDEVPSDWHADFTLLCQGDSMEPKIKDSDVVAIHCQPMVENGEVAAVLIDGEATLKRVFLFDDHIELRAENPTFPTILRIGEDMNTITIEGKAVGLCRKL
ncbi:LexA family protein [Gemmiger formicilis]|uniref:LexA family protein n=1 Tax=Gemmiger formicilis TaxID=745368 RepID=UPI003CCAE7AE